jgi:serine/threonine-protein kinase RsbW
MICSRLELCRQDLVPHENGDPLWQQDLVESLADMERILDAISVQMKQLGFSESEDFRVHLALEEAIINAYKHGNRRDWNKAIIVRYHVSAGGVVAQVDDEGPGFDPASVPNPLAPENLEKPSGRGLFLMRTYLSGVCHNERGNRICLCKHNSSHAATE